MNPRYQAQFAKPLVDQLIAILQRDQQAALDIVNAARPAGRELKPFAAFHKEVVTVHNWPALVIVPQEISFDADSDADLRTESVRFLCAMAISGTDPEWLAEDALGYLRVVDIVLTSAPLGDFYAPLSIYHRTVPDGQTAGLDASVSRVLDLRVTRHDLGVLVGRSRSAGLARGPQIEFVVELEEKREQVSGVRSQVSEGRAQWTVDSAQQPGPRLPHVHYSLFTLHYSLHFCCSLCTVHCPLLSRPRTSPAPTTSAPTRG